VTLDSTPSFDKHIIDVTRSCHYHVRALCHIRQLLTLDTAEAMAVITGLLQHCAVWNVASEHKQATVCAEHFGTGCGTGTVDC